MNMDHIESVVSREAKATPKLTIGIPTWNRNVMLAEQIQAIEEKLTSEVELLICDNGSDDNTFVMLKEFVGRTSKRVRCMRNRVNLGADVNYLRIHEAADGDWVWLVGDDDKIDFSVLPFIMQALLGTVSAIVLLEDDGTSGAHSPLKAIRKSPEEFFLVQNDPLGLEILQVGRVLCRTASTRPLLRKAYALGVGKMHSYAFLYGPLVMENGVEVIKCPLLLSRQHEAKRWNALQAHMGAWESSLEIYGPRGADTRAREIRLRQRAVLMAVLGALVTNETVTAGTAARLRKLLDIRGKAFLTALLISFGISQSLCLRVLRYIRPQYIEELTGQGKSATFDY